MTEAPQIKHVIYDTSAMVLDREHIEGLKALQDDTGSTSLISELFTLFISENQEKINQLESVCIARDDVTLKRIVHFIAGGAGNIGLMRLSALCRGVEEAICKGVFLDYEACARLIPQEYELATTAFREILGAD